MLVALWTIPHSEAQLGAWLGVLVLLLSPWCWGRLARRSLQGTMVLECLLGAAAIGIAGLPAALAVAVLGLLVVALTARDGPGEGLAAAVLVTLGWAAGRLVSPLALLDGGAGLGVLSVVLVLSVCGPIAALAFRASERHTRARRVLEMRAAGLGDVADALAAYLPEALTSRLFDRRLEPILERRWVTVCFVDLAGFTALVDRLAPESVIELLDDFSKMMSALARAYRATLDKLLGDGVLLFFTTDRPDQRMQRAQACRWLIEELGTAIDRLGRRWRGRGLDAALGVRCGIASGFCSVGDIGDAARRHYTVVGGPVNLAARLQQMAEIDGALVDAATAGLIDSDALVAMGERDIKGIPRRVAVFALPLRLDEACPSASAAASAKVRRPEPSSRDRAT